MFFFYILAYFALFIQEDGDKFDDYDHQMMLNGLGLEDKTICNCLVAFHKDMKSLMGGRLY